MNKSGIIILNKHKDISTNRLIQNVKRNLNVKKIGHAGTLDPLATGVVVCLVNNGTKLSDYFLNENKAYEVTMKLFEATDTYDSDGTIIETQQAFEISKEKVEEVIAEFNGLTYDQEPPIYSAIKIGGKKLYEYARENQRVDINKRKVTIKSLTLNKYEDNQISLTAFCSKGTYIRSLVVDIAKALNTIAHVVVLNRIESGCFNIKNAIDVDNVDEQSIISMYDAVSMAGYEIITYDDILSVQQGKKIYVDSESELIFISDQNKNLLACYEKENNSLYKCKRGGFDN